MRGSRTGRSIERRRRVKTSRRSHSIPQAISLESRCLLAAPGDLVPGTLYTDAAWYDSNGDTVEVQVIGGTGGFTITLEGGAVNNADADRINLIGLSAESSLIISVTPNELSIAAGAPFNHMFTSGYTNVRQIAAEADPHHPAAPMTQIDGIQLSAALVARIDLPDVTIGNMSLDTGIAPYVDRVNTTTINQTLESGMYLPVTGLIDMGSIFAANVGSIVIDGVISAKTGNANDPSQTNDFKGLIEVTGSIGSVVGLHSSLNGAIRAASIGTVKVAAIAGELTTSSDLTIGLPAAFKGFITAGGHLNLEFPQSDGKLMTGQIQAGGGISGSSPSLTDEMKLPDGFGALIIDESPAQGIADIAVNGIAGMRIISAKGELGDVHIRSGNWSALTTAHKIGNVTVDSGSLLMANFVSRTSIGDIYVMVNQQQSILGGSIIAGTHIGQIEAYSHIGTSVSGLLIQAEGDIEGDTAISYGNQVFPPLPPGHFLRRSNCPRTVFRRPGSSVGRSAP